MDIHISDDFGWPRAGLSMAMACPLPQLGQRPTSAAASRSRRNMPRRRPPEIGSR